MKTNHKTSSATILVVLAILLFALQYGQGSLLGFAGGAGSGTGCGGEVIEAGPVMVRAEALSADEGYPVWVRQDWEGEFDTRYTQLYDRHGTWMTSPTSPRTRPMVGDFDGDGRSDVTYHGLCGDSAPCWRTHLSDGEGFETVSFPGSNWFHAHDDYLHAPYVGDFNGDGLDDIVYRGYCGQHDGSQAECWRVMESQGLNFNPAEYVDPIGPQPLPDMQTNLKHRPMVGDFNNDGRDDLIYRGCPREDGGLGWQVHLFAAAGPATVETTCMHELPGTPGAWMSGASNDELRAPVVGDFDGDGFDDDIIYLGLAGASQLSWRIHVGTPAGFSADAWYNDHGHYPPHGGQHYVGRRLFVGDFDGNGRDDLQYVARHFQTGEPVWLLMKSMPDNTFKGERRGDPTQLGPVSQTSLHQLPLSGDFDGDGRSELLQVGTAERIAELECQQDADCDDIIDGRGAKLLVKQTEQTVVIEGLGVGLEWLRIDSPGVSAARDDDGRVLRYEFSGDVTLSMPHETVGLGGCTEFTVALQPDFAMHANCQADRLTFSRLVVPNQMSVADTATLSLQLVLGRELDGETLTLANSGANSGADSGADDGGALPFVQLDNDQYYFHLRTTARHRFGPPGAIPNYTPQAAATMDILVAPQDPMIVLGGEIASTVPKIPSGRATVGLSMGKHLQLPLGEKLAALMGTASTTVTGHAGFVTTFKKAGIVEVNGHILMDLDADGDNTLTFPHPGQGRQRQRIYGGGTIEAVIPEFLNSGGLDIGGHLKLGEGEFIEDGEAGTFNFYAAMDGQPFEGTALSFLKTSGGGGAIGSVEPSGDFDIQLTGVTRIDGLATKSDLRISKRGDEVNLHVEALLTPTVRLDEHQHLLSHGPVNATDIVNNLHAPANVGLRLDVSSKDGAEATMFTLVNSTYVEKSVTVARGDIENLAGAIATLLPDPPDAGAYEQVLSAVGHDTACKFSIASCGQVDGNPHCGWCADGLGGAMYGSPDGPAGAIGFQCQNWAWDADQCPSAGCVSDSQCGDSQFCSFSGLCLARLPTGMFCANDGDCISGDCDVVCKGPLIPEGTAEVLIEAGCTAANVIGLGSVIGC